jgi:hypothetical protein
MIVLDDVFQAHIPQGKASHCKDEHLLLGQSGFFYMY